MARPLLRNEAWFFGYGSLLWNPDFRYAERLPAHLPGYRRWFCRYSFHYRGTAEKPGLVIGLIPGGSCAGVVYRVEPADVQETLQRLDAREQPGYLRKRTSVMLPRGHSPRFVEAWFYLPNPEDPSYFGQQDEATLVRLTAEGAGSRGTSYDYLHAMLLELQVLGVREQALERIVRQAAALRGQACQI